MSTSSSTALTKRTSENALMPPPPPLKRIKRPAKVLDEEEYTAALSGIIARDFFPGLLESQAQQEYLNALESNDKEWIRSAGQRLSEAMTAVPGKRRARATRLDPSRTPKPDATPIYGDETPKGWGGATPSVAGTEISDIQSDIAKTKGIEISGTSLSAFQQKYTSEDNESFNALLDEQNQKRREKYAHLWNNNKIPAPRQLLHRARETKLLAGNPASDEKSLIPITTGATTSRPAQPTSWKQSDPANSFMFNPSSIEDTHETVAQKRESESRAAPKQTIYSNTRLPLPDTSDTVPPSPSISAVRDAIAGRPRLSSSERGGSSDIYTGAETPRVNGYAFVDEDEPNAEPESSSSLETENPSYRDLLAGQYSDTPNPFKLSETSRRENLHHRMVEKTAAQKREKRKDTVKTPVADVPRFASSPMIGQRTPVLAGGAGSAGKGEVGGMTPAARRLIEKMKTPVAGSGGAGAKAMGKGSEGESGSGLRNMWTPTPRNSTPKRKAGSSRK